MISVVEYTNKLEKENHTDKSAIEPFADRLDESATEEPNEIIVIGADKAICTNDYIATKLKVISEDKDLRIILDDFSFFEENLFRKLYREIKYEVFLVDTSVYFSPAFPIRDTICEIAREVYADASDAMHRRFAETISSVTVVAADTASPRAHLATVARAPTPMLPSSPSDGFLHKNSGLYFPPVPKQSWIEYAKTLPAPGRGRKRDPTNFILFAYSEYITQGLLYYPHLKKSDLALYNAAWSFVGRSGGAKDMETFFKALNILTPSDLEKPDGRDAARATAIVAINVKLSGEKAVRGYIKTRRTKIVAKRSIRSCPTRTPSV